MRRILTVALPVALVAYGSLSHAAEPAGVGTASTAKAERPDVKVGDKWVSACTQYSKKFDVVTVVTSVDQSGIKGTQNGKPLAMTPDLNTTVSPRWTDTDARALSFPLEVGKQWKAGNEWVDHQSDSPGGIDEGSEQLSVTVVGYEKVRVPAGEFDAFKLKWKSNWTAKSGAVGTTETTYWYAPATRGVVKLDRRISWAGGGEPELKCELTEFQLQP